MPSTATPAPCNPRSSGSPPGWLASTRQPRCTPPSVGTRRRRRPAIAGPTAAGRRRALAASPALLEWPPGCRPPPTALADALDRAHQLVGSWSATQAIGRVPTGAAAPTLQPHRAAQPAAAPEAAAAVATAPPPPQRWSPPAPPPPAGAIDDLTVTLARRHIASRPYRPGLPPAQSGPRVGSRSRVT